MPRTYATGKPRSYGREKLSTLRSRYQGDYKAIMEPMIPVAFPGAPREGMLLAMLGFTAFSTGWTENTTEAVATQSFHEVGPFQVPAGPRTGPAPNPNASVGNNAYGALHATPLVQDMIRASSGTRRPATMTNNGWKTDKHSSCAVGIANLLRDEASIRASMGALVGDPGAWSHWRLWCMFTSFSRGPGQTANILRPYRNALLAVPEGQRLRAFRGMIVRDIASNASGIGSRKGRMGAAYGIVRSDQKLESAVALATAINGPLDFFNERYTAADDATEDAITRCAYGVDARAIASSAAEAASNVANIAVEGVKQALAGTFTVDRTGKIAGAIVIGGVAVVTGASIYMNRE